MIDDTNRRAKGHYAQAAAEVVFEDAEQQEVEVAASTTKAPAPPTFEALTKKWDSFADLYSDTYQDWSFPGLQQLVSNMWLRERDGNLSIIEVGCGPGAGTARVLPQIPKAARYVPCDYSAEMVKLARKNLPEDRVPLILQCPASKVPLPDASFDRYIRQVPLTLTLATASDTTCPRQQFRLGRTYVLAALRRTLPYG